MDKKKVIFTILFTLLSIHLFSQQNYSYQPISKSEQKDIDNIILTNSVSSFVIDQSIPLGPINLTNVMNMVSYNQIEGTRIRISMETNSKTFAFNKFLRNRLAFSVMAAYGTKDNKFKYAFGGAFNFAKKPSSIYSFPCSTLNINWEDNTYIPSSPNYDVAFLSFGKWDRFYFASKKQLTVSFLQEFANTLAIRPFAYYQKIDSYILYNNEVTTQLLNPEYEYTNKAAGVEFSYTPTRKIKNLFNIFNSRFYTLHTQFKINYSYNSNEYIAKKNYHKIEAFAQHRFYFKPMALDIKINGGKIFNQSDYFTYFSPDYRVSTVSNNFGFNLYSPYEMMFQEYMQAYMQLNLGGILLDNIEFLEQFRPNEFINFKALFTKHNNPYFEAGIGIDHILGVLGVEFVKRFANTNPFNMPEWAIKIRCNVF